jgi:multidrug resistance efflux pump
MYEAQAQYWRAQISLNNQQLNVFMAGQNAPNLRQVFANELQSIDSDVRRWQFAYLNTLLMSPIGGVITGIYKNAGDWVQAGEPVIRVENNQYTILAGTLKYRGAPPISIGQTLTVTTSVFDDALPGTEIIANIIAVRGHPKEDDLWEVHAIYITAGQSAPSLPTNYSFDYDNTSATIS